MKQKIALGAVSVMVLGLAGCASQQTASHLGGNAADSRQVAIMPYASQGVEVQGTTTWFYGRNEGMRAYPTIGGVRYIDESEDSLEKLKRTAELKLAEAEAQGFLAQKQKDDAQQELNRLSELERAALIAALSDLNNLSPEERAALIEAVSELDYLEAAERTALLAAVAKLLAQKSEGDEEGLSASKEELEKLLAGYGLLGAENKGLSASNNRLSDKLAAYDIEVGSGEPHIEQWDAQHQLIRRDIEGLERLATLRFHFNKHDEMYSHSKELFKKFFQEINDEHNKFVVIGYTDDVGLDDINIPLSSRRANFIAEQLHKAFPEAEIISHGSGPYPRAMDNRMKNGRTMNRRVEIYGGRK